MCVCLHAILARAIAFLSMHFLLIAFIFASMPPQRKLSVVKTFPELQNVPRLQLVSLLKKIQANIDEVQQVPANKIACANDYHANFSVVSVAEVFPYADKPGGFNMEYDDPCLLVQHVLAHCPKLARRWVAGLQNGSGTASNPWHTIIGFDEFQPGSKLSFDKAKAVMCLYFNFAEVGAASEGSTWFCPVSVRSAEIDSVSGGWSRVLASIVHRMFLGMHGFTTVGVALTYRNRAYVVFAKLCILLSDGDGLRKGLGWKGGNSIRTSIIHGNILKKDSDLAGRRPGFVEIDCSDHRKLHKTNPQEFQDSCDLVRAAHERYERTKHLPNGMRKGMLESILKSRGMNYVPGGIAFDLRLKALCIFAAVTVDWVHKYLQDGFFTVEAWLMIMAAGEFKNPEDLATFLKLAWQFPASMEGKGKLLWRIFCHHRLDDNGELDKIRASASELLGLYSLLRHFFATRVAVHSEALIANWLSFEACCEVIDLILAAKKKVVSPREASGMLRQKIGRFMQLHNACYGKAHLRPKHAWQWAIAEHWDRDDAVWDAFIIERMHLLVKSTAARLRNTSRMEMTVLSGTLNAQIASLQTLNGPCCFLDSPIVMDVLPDVLFADSMQVWGMSMRVGDVVFHRGSAGKLAACALEDGVFHGIVEMFVEFAVITKKAKTWQIGTRDFRAVPANDLDQAAHIYTHFISICF